MWIHRSIHIWTCRTLTNIYNRAKHRIGTVKPSGRYLCQQGGPLTRGTTRPSRRQHELWTKLDIRHSIYRSFWQTTARLATSSSAIHCKHVVNARQLPPAKRLDNRPFVNTELYWFIYWGLWSCLNEAFLVKATANLS